MVRAERRGRVCVSCYLLRDNAPWNKGKFSEKKSQSINEGVIWEENGIWYRKCIICNRLVGSSYHHNTYKRLNVPCHKCGILKNVGSKRSTETRNKQRISAIKRLQRYQLYNKPNFNPCACYFIDNLNYSLGLNFQHALNGGEVWLSGFYPDGYDREKNIIFEYDEPWHKSEKSKKHDAWKETRIIENIHPKMFIRYDKKSNRLYDSITGIDIPTNPSVFV